MAIPKFPENQLVEIGKILGDTGGGLTGSEIASLLARCSLPDPGPITKRDRIHRGLSEGQERYGSGQKVIEFIQVAMDPVRYRSDATVFNQRLYELNVVLGFAGLRLRDDGKIEPAPVATTLSEAQRRADRLRSELMRRGIAGDVLRFCRPELLDGDYFHAVFEATKSVAQKLRDKTGLALDGHRLVEEALSIKNGRSPLLAWNRLSTDNDRSEHQGVALILAGTFSYFRNLPAHVPRVHRVVTEEEALEVLTILSFLHRRLDQAVSTSPRRLP